MATKTSAEEGAVPELIASCKMFECCMTPMLFKVLVYTFRLLVVTTPVNEGSCMGALRFKTLCVAVDIGRSEGLVFATLKSERLVTVAFVPVDVKWLWFVLYRLPSPTIAGVIPLTVP